MRVEVHIGGEVAASLKSSVSQASGSMRAFSSEIRGLSRGISDVGSYRKLRSEVFETATQFRSAKQELSVLSDQVNAQKNHLGSLQGKLQEQRSATKAASLLDFGQILDCQLGVETANITLGAKKQFNQLIL